MAKATIVHITRIGEDGIGVRWKEKYLLLSSFDYVHRNLKITAPIGCMTLPMFASFVIGCFESRSTFEGVQSITFTFNGYTATVHRDKALNNPAYVISEWEKAKKMAE